MHARGKRPIRSLPASWRTRIASPPSASRAVSALFQTGLASFVHQVKLRRVPMYAARGGSQTVYRLFAAEQQTLEPLMDYRGRSGFGKVIPVIAWAKARRPRPCVKPFSLSCWSAPLSGRGVRQRPRAAMGPGPSAAIARSKQRRRNRRARPQVDAKQRIILRQVGAVEGRGRPTAEPWCTRTFSRSGNQICANRIRSIDRRSKSPGESRRLTILARNNRQRHLYLRQRRPNR